MPDVESGTLIVEGELRDGFTALPNSVLHRKELPVGARMLYAVLLSFAWGKERVWPGYDTLMDMMGVGSKSTVSSWLKLLEAHGLLTRARRFGKTTIYTLHILPVVQKSNHPVVQNVDNSRTGSVRSVVQEVDRNNTQEKNTQKKNTKYSPEQVAEMHAIWRVLSDETMGGFEPVGRVSEFTKVCWSLVDRGATADKVRQVARRLKQTWSIPVSFQAVSRHYESTISQGVKGERGGLGYSAASTDGWNFDTDPV